MAAPAARRRVPSARRGGTVLLAVALLTVALVPLTAGRADDRRPSVEVVMPDTGLTVSDLVTVVRDAADGAGSTEPERDVRIVFASALPDGSGGDYVGGLRRGSTVWVRIGGPAMPTRTLLHELAHVFTPTASHDEPFRQVYLAAVEHVYGRSTALREERRMAWVYDRCYLDDSCPEIRTPVEGERP